MVYAPNAGENKGSFMTDVAGVCSMFDTSCASSQHCADERAVNFSVCRIKSSLTISISSIRSSNHGGWQDGCVTITMIVVTLPGRDLAKFRSVTNPQTVFATCLLRRQILIYRFSPEPLGYPWLKSI